jgi:hypothetical protein
MPLHRFIEAVDLSMYADYQKERIAAGLWKRSSARVSPAPVTQPSPVRLEAVNPVDLAGSDLLSPLARVDKLGPEHRARLLCEKRKLPDLTRVFHCPKFYAWTNWVLKREKFSKKALYYDHPRLIIPFFDGNGEFIAFQGRDYNPDSDNKYVTILVDESAPKLYGLDRVKDGIIYAVEGPIDSMFLPNGIAFAGGDHSILEVLDPSRVVVIYDNEPRAPLTIRKIQKAITHGYQVCIWPKYVVEKDINDMVIDGLDVKSIIDSRTFRGLSAELELSAWRG